MKKIDKAAWTITACMLVLAAASMFFLPGELAIQWNQSGVSNTAPKWIVFLFPVLAAFCIILRTVQSTGKVKTGSACFIGVLVIFAAEAVIICNGAGLFEITTADSRLFTKFAAIVLGCLLIYFGNKLPKTARNYYVGVKAPWAFENDDIWTKTQRFAAKVWVIAGIALVAVSFAPGFVPSAMSLVCIFTVVLLPRIYSKHIFEETQNTHRK